MCLRCERNGTTIRLHRHDQAPWRRYWCDKRGNAILGCFCPKQPNRPRHDVGASGNVAVGLGLGAKVLIGGSRRTITLQPLSVEGQIGLNLALGVANLILR
jgi:hypothetical protein